MQPNLKIKLTLFRWINRLIVFAYLILFIYIGWVHFYNDPSLATTTFRFIGTHAVIGAISTVFNFCLGINAGIMLEKVYVAMRRDQMPNDIFVYFAFAVLCIIGGPIISLVALNGDRQNRNITRK